MCRKELHAVADTNFDDVGSNTGGDVVQATSDDNAEIGVDVPESASKESSVEEVSSESDEAADVKDGSDGEEMIEQLKGKFCSTVSRSEKLMILTILPKSWSLKKISRVFGVSRYLARRAKLLVAEKGVLSSPNPQHINTLSLQTGEAVSFLMT